MLAEPHGSASDQAQKGEHERCHDRPSSGVDRAMTIGPTRLLAKSGGASGNFVADEPLSGASSEEPSLRAAAPQRGGGHDALS